MQHVQNAFVLDFGKIEFKRINMQNINQLITVPSLKCKVLNLCLCR